MALLAPFLCLAFIEKLRSLTANGAAKMLLNHSINEGHIL